MKEHDIVRLKETYLDIPAGMTGVVIYTYQNIKMLEVEFLVGDVSKVVTLSPNHLEVV